MNKDTFTKRMAQIIATEVKDKGFCLQLYGDSLSKERNQIAGILGTTYKIKTVRCSDYAYVHLASNLTPNSAEEIRQQIQAICCRNMLDSPLRLRITSNSFSNMMQAMLSDLPAENPTDDDFIGENNTISNR